MNKFNNTILFISFSVFGLSDNLISPLQKIIIFLFLITLFIINSKDKNFTTSFFSDKFTTFFTYSYFIFFIGLIISSIFAGFANISESLLYAGLWLLKLSLLINLSRKVECYKLLRYFALSISLSSILNILTNRELMQNILLIRFIKTFLNSGGSFRTSIEAYHPNQLAAIFGFIILFLIFRLIEKLLINKNLKLNFRSILIEISYICLIFFSFAILIISSSRSVFLAILTVIALTFLTFIRLDKKNIQRNLIISTIIIFIGSKLINFNSIFLINDQYRGIGTGLTGRIDIFSILIDRLSFLGMGYLDEPSKYIGYGYHNSYLSVLSQSGLVFGSFIIFSIFFITYILVKLFMNPKLNKEYFCLLFFMPYLLIHNIFESHLLGMTSIDSFVFIFIIYGRFIIGNNIKHRYLKNQN